MEVSEVPARPGDTLRVADTGKWTPYRVLGRPWPMHVHHMRPLSGDTDVASAVGTMLQVGRVVRYNAEVVVRGLQFKGTPATATFLYDPPVPTTLSDSPSVDYATALVVAHTLKGPLHEVIGAAVQSDPERGAFLVTLSHSRGEVVDDVSVTVAGSYILAE